MRLAGRPFQLTYCTNVHPGNGWREVFAQLRHYAPALKARLSPDAPFGIGLRLSGLESRELQGGALARFKSFLDEEGLYVFTLNGFPHGPFHREPVKAKVHAPDWREEERVLYTLRLVKILAALLPAGTSGSLSTSPLSYKAWLDAGDEASWELLTTNVVRVAERLVKLNETGTLIHLDLEPEPDGLLENSLEVVYFFEDWLLTFGARGLAERLGVGREEARAHLLEHVRVCFDTCHVAVAYEEPAEVLARFAEHGIRVGKVQISSALELPLPGAREGRGGLRAALQPFAESVYLHQVVQRNRDGSLTRYPDLQGCLDRIDDPEASEWRVHFHVPIFVESYGAFASTQDGILKTFELLREEAFCEHLEIETYTWEVLPRGLKRDLTESIAREYRWVLDVL
jgi:sugar phosphate isomerase/epimerase